MACMGFSLSSGFRAAISLSSFLDRFLCSIWTPVSSPRPAVLQKPTRAGAVKVGRRTNLSTPSTFARPYLDSSEHGGTLNAVGMTIRGGARFRSRGLIAPHPCMRWIQGIRTMMQIYASAARLRSSGAQSFDRHESHAMVRATATSDRAWRIVSLKSAGAPKLEFLSSCWSLDSAVAYAAGFNSKP
jgi:hypothetical protein